MIVDLMGKSAKEVGVGFCCRWIVNVGCLFGRLKVARLQPKPSVMTRLDPRQHSLLNGCRDFFTFDVAFLVGAVAETVFLEEPARAAFAPVIPLGAFVNLLACKV